MSAKILIVDDDAELLRLIGLALHRSGYEPIGAQNAEVALEKVRNEQPALVILDVMLPGASGIDLCRKLRSQAKTLPLPIIMVSARAQVDDKIEGLEAGADEYLTKPVSPKELVVRVTSLLERTERLRGAGVSQRGTVVGVLGAKGGVGTTTVAINLAVALALLDSSVIAVELRSQSGTFATHLGTEPAETMKGLLNLPDGTINERALRTRLMPDASGVEVLFAPGENNELAEFSPQQADAVIEGLARMASMVVLDIPPLISEATIAALRQCDQILLVTRPEDDSIAAGRRLLDLIKSWGIGRGVVDAIVVNHVPLAVGLNIGSISKQLSCNILGIIPPAADAFAHALRQHRPLLTLQPGSPAVSKIRELGEQIVARQTV